jgi:hypothetical protein
MTTAKDVLKMIKDNDVKYCDLRFTDPRGKWQHVTFDIGMIEEETFSEGRDRRLLAVAGTPAEGHGRTSCDLERGRYRYAGRHEPAALPISSRPTPPIVFRSLSAGLIADPSYETRW